MKLMAMFSIVFCFGLVQADVAKYFIYPIVGDNESIVGVAGNIDNPRSHGWHTNGNWFGHDFGSCPLPKDNNPNECGCDNDNYRYHPGEDWNKEGLNTADANAPVYSIGTGIVVRRSVADAQSPNGYVIILYELPQVIDFSGYFLSGTTVSSTYQNSKWVGFDYYHIIVDQSLQVGDRVVRGQKLGVIDPDNPSSADPSGPHLHFEGMVFTNQQVQQIFQGIQSGNISTVATSARNCCGYYLSQQDITNHGYINPTQFIADHVQPSSISGLTYVDSWTCDGWTVGSSFGDKDPINARPVFNKGDNVCCLTELTNVSVNHRFKVEAYCNDRKMWEYVDAGGWRNVALPWAYSHFYPFWSGVPEGSNEFRIFVDIDDPNSCDNVDDWRIVATKKFSAYASIPEFRIAAFNSSAPENLVINSVSNNSVTLGWSQGQYAASNPNYIIYRSTSQYSSSASEIATTSSNSYSDGNLSSNTKYYYWVKASIGSELSSFSDSVGVTTQSQSGNNSTPLAPGDPVCGFESSIQVMVRWSCGSNDPYNIASYKLFMGTSNNSSQASCCGTTYSTDMFSPALNSASTYWFWVKAVNHNGAESGFSSVATVNMANYISPPENLIGVNSNGSVNLSWSCQTSSVVFKVYRATQSDFSDQQVVSQQYPLSYIDANCQSGTTYYYRVCSALNGVVSNYSNYVSFTTSVFPPPDSFRIVEVKPGRVKLAWNRSPGTIYDYQIFQQYNNVQQWGHVVYDTFYVDSTPVCGKTYSYRIRARSSQLSDVSSPLYATIPFKKKVYTDFVYLPDVDSNGYAEVASLFKKGEDSTLVSILDLGNNQVLQTFYLGNYQPNSLEKINVGGQTKLLAAVNDSANDTTIFSILDVGLNRQTFVLSPPVNFQSTSSSFDQIRFSWGLGNNSDSVGIQYCLYASQSSDSSLAQFIGSTSGTSYVQAGLSPGGTWRYWLRATAGLEVSSFAGSVTASTNQLLAPTNFVASQVTSAQVVLGWTAVSGVQSYRVYRDGYSLGNTYANSITDASVVPLNHYSYQVVSVVGNYYSSPSDALSVFTPYQYLTSVDPMKNVADAEFLHDLDQDSLPEVAVLGIDSVTKKSAVLVKNSNTNQVLSMIQFFSDSNTVPLNFFPVYLNGNNAPAFTVMGKIANVDSVKTETRSFLGTKISN
jgi:murein DD-endopeptidase MepM/ murein hydrolase activator NlpD